YDNSRNRVVTPSRGERNAGSQQFEERPAVISQSQSHRWRAVVIATHTLDQRQPQGRMGAMKVVIEQLQADEGIEGGIAFGKGVRFAGERIEPVAQSPVESFDMHGARWLDQHPQRGTGLHPEQVSVLIA